MARSPQGVRINVIAPGPILTDHLRAAGETAQQMAAHSVPLGRIGSTADVAACVLWLCSDDASFITGVTLPVDGGQSAGTKLRQTYRPGQSMDESADETSGVPSSPGRQASLRSHQN